MLGKEGYSMAKNKNQNQKQNGKQRNQEAPAMSFTQNSGKQEERGENRQP